MYIVDLLSDSSRRLRSGRRENLRSAMNREESSCEWRLATMSTRFFLYLAALAVILVALGSATVQLTAGRRPVLLGGRAG